MQIRQEEKENDRGRMHGKANEETANWEADEYTWLIDSVFLNQIPYLLRKIITGKKKVI